jgi:hypothetical protein
MFSVPANYGVVKIAHSSFKVVLRTMKHTMIYPGSDPSSEVIALYLVFYILKMNMCYKGVSKELKNFTW